MRFLISQGYKLPEVCERLLDHLVAPDTDTDSPVGCDNMTVMVVALLNGKTEEEWYAQVSSRAKQNPECQRLPTLYPEFRVSRFEKKKAMMSERERLRQQNDPATAGSGSTTPTQGTEETLFFGGKHTEPLASA